MSKPTGRSSRSTVLTHPTLLTPRTPCTFRRVASYGKITVDFDTATQSLSALNVAAYRLIGTGACQIEQIGTRYVCRLTPTAQMDSEGVRSQFLNLVTDENV